MKRLIILITMLMLLIPSLGLSESISFRILSDTPANIKVKVEIIDYTTNENDFSEIYELKTPTDFSEYFIVNVNRGITIIVTLDPYDIDNLLYVYLYVYNEYKNGYDMFLTVGAGDRSLALGYRFLPEEVRYD